MQLDALNEFCSHMPVADLSGFLPDVIELDPQGKWRNIGAGTTVVWYATASYDAKSLSGTTFSLVTSDNEDMSNGIVLQTMNVDADTMHGLLFASRIPSAKYKKFLGVAIDGATAPAPDPENRTDNYGTSRAPKDVGYKTYITCGLALEHDVMVAYPATPIYTPSNTDGKGSSNCLDC